MNIRKGIVSVTFKNLSVEAVIDLAVKAGLSGIEWSEGHHVPAEDTAEAARIGALTAISGLRTVEYGSYYKLGEGMDFRPRMLNAAALGTRTIRIWGGVKPSAELAADERATLVREAQRIADEASAMGMDIVIEWHRNTVTDTNESGLSFLEEVGRDNFRTLWQPSMAMDEEERKRGIRMLGKRIANLHVFHWDASGRRPLSEGKEEWKGYTKALCDDFSGYALMEFVKDDAPEQFLEDAAALSSWLSQS